MSKWNKQVNRKYRCILTDFWTRERIYKDKSNKNSDWLYWSTLKKGKPKMQWQIKQKISNDYTKQKKKKKLHAVVYYYKSFLTLSKEHFASTEWQGCELTV